jgi:hypothetical protein
MAERELFRVLGLSPGATPEELKRAYRTLVKKYHPDSRGGRGNALAFSRVVSAYQSIMQEQMARARPARAAGRAAHEPRTQAPKRPGQGGGPRAWASRPAAAKAAILDLFALGRLLLMSTEPVARASAARELGKSGKSSAYAFLRKAFWDRDEKVLLSVVRAVGDLGICQSAGELASLYSKASPAVRRAILTVAGTIGISDGFMSILRLASSDPDPAIRLQAAGMRKG